MNDCSSNDFATSEAVQVLDHELQLIIETMRSEQNLAAAVLAGTVAALGGAVLWGLVTALSGYQIGWIAIGIGFLVGFAVRVFGHGVDPRFGFVAAGLSLAGCMLGNLLAITHLIAVNEELIYSDVLSQLDFGIAGGILISTSSYTDLLFYGLAAYFGYRYAFRQFTESDLSRSLERAT